MLVLVVVIVVAQNVVVKRWSTGSCMSKGLRHPSGLVYGFLFLPIAVLVVLSFNRSGLPTSWGGFSTEVVRGDWPATRRCVRACATR